MVNKYIIETKKGYISEFTLIFDKESWWYIDAYKFREEDLKKFFMFRDKNKYKVYKIAE